MKAIVRSFKEVAADRAAVIFIAWFFALGFWAGIALGIATKFS